VLPDPCKPSLPLLAKTTATWGHFTTTKFFITATFTTIFLASFPATFFSFSTQIPLLLGVFAVEVVASPAGVSCLKLAFLLLLGSLLVPTSLLLLAFLLLLVCHKWVSDGHGHFHGHQFSTDIQLLKLPLYGKWP
jgi:hypothetical protein